jgi:hypothetical protein
MSAEIFRFNGITRHELPPDQVLEQTAGILDSVLLMGWHKDGTFYTAASGPSIPEALMMLELCKKRLMDNATAGE